MTQISKKEEIVKLREMINEIETKKIVKTKTTKTWIFERINKIDERVYLYLIRKNIYK